jgi:hypothetical protein
MEIKIGMSKKYLVVEEEIINVLPDKQGKDIRKHTVTRIIELGDIDIKMDKIKTYYKDKDQVITVNGIKISIHNKYSESETHLYIKPITITEYGLIPIIIDRIVRFLKDDKERILNLNEFLKKNRCRSRNSENNNMVKILLLSNFLLFF